jgi:hypothetical protein
MWPSSLSAVATWKAKAGEVKLGRGQGSRLLATREGTLAKHRWWDVGGQNEAGGQSCKLKGAA